MGNRCHLEEDIFDDKIMNLKRIDRSQTPIYRCTAPYFRYSSVEIVVFDR